MEFNLVQFIKDFQIVSILFLGLLFGWGYKSTNGRITELKRELHEDHEQQKKELTKKFEKLEEKQKDYYDRLWNEWRDIKDKMTEFVERIVRTESEVDHLKENFNILDFLKKERDK